MILLKGFQISGDLDANKKKSAIRRSFLGESRRTPPKQKERPTAWSQVKPQFAKIKVEQKRVNVVLQNL